MSLLVCFNYCSLFINQIANRIGVISMLPLLGKKFVTGSKEEELFYKMSGSIGRCKK